jgi:multisubunit Na+/H+ antiporter MnhE subunit
VTRRLGTVAALAAFYLAVLGDPRPLDVPVAILVAVAAAAAVGASPVGGGRRAAPRIAGLPALVAQVAGEVATGTVRVALATIGVRPPRRPGVVRIDVGRSSERALVLTGVLLTVSPGSVLVAVDGDAGSLDVHVVDGEDPEAVRAGVRRLHERVTRVVGE